MRHHRPLATLTAHLVLAILLAACGKTEIPPGAQSQQAGFNNLNQCSSNDDDAKLPDQALETRIWNAAHGRLTCEYNGECNPAVTMVSVVIKKTIERCTGFLIAPDMIVTNDHCVSNSTAVREFGGRCDNLIFAHFAAAGDGSQEQSVGCKRIVMRSNQCGLGSKDYAVIQLEHPLTDRQPLRVASRGFANGEDATIYRVQMSSLTSSGVHTGTQSKTVCPATYHTMVYPALQSPRSPLMTFGDCPIQKGNSGSPALNQDGDVGAIIQGYLEPPEDNKIRDQLQAVLLDRNFGEVGLGTQLACAPELTRGRASCTDIAPIYTLYPKKFMSDVGELDPRLLPAIGRGEVWRQVSAPSLEQRLFVRTPACVNPSRADSFQSSIQLFKRGINRQLVAEWRQVYRDDQKTTVFEAVGTSVGANGMVPYRSRDFGSILVPVCGRLTQR